MCREYGRTFITCYVACHGFIVGHSADRNDTYTALPSPVSVISDRVGGPSPSADWTDDDCDDDDDGDCHVMPTQSDNHA